MSPAPNVKLQLLALSDLPSGWSVDTSASSSSSSSISGEPACFKAARDAVKNAGEKARAEADYADGSNGVPSLEEIIGYVPNSAAAFTAVTSAMDSCGAIKLSEGGQTLTGQMGAMSFPALGDASKAYQMNLSTTANGLNVTVGFDVVYVRTGDEVVQVQYEDLGTPDVAQLQTLTTQAVAKITGKPSTVTAGATSASGDTANLPTADVAITACTIDTFGRADAKGLVTNHSSKMSDYDIEIAFIDQTGTRVDTGVDFVNNLAPGAKADFDAGGTTQIKPGTHLTCSLLSVDRVAASG